MQTENIFYGFKDKIPAEIAQELYVQMKRRKHQRGMNRNFNEIELTALHSAVSVKTNIPHQYQLMISSAYEENEELSKTVHNFLLTFYQNRLNMLPIIGKKAANEFVYRDLYEFMETYKS